MSSIRAMSMDERVKSITSKFAAMLAGFVDMVLMLTPMLVLMLVLLQRVAVGQQ